MNPKKDFFPLDGQLFCEKIAILIKQKRLEKRLRQDDLAQAVQSSLSTIKRIEKGDRSVEYGIIIKILWYLGILDGLNAALPEVALNNHPQRRIRLSHIAEDDF